MRICEMFISRSTPKIGFFNTLLTASSIELFRPIKKDSVLICCGKQMILKGPYLWAFVDGF